MVLGNENTGKILTLVSLRKLLDSSRSYNCLNNFTSPSSSEIQCTCPTGLVKVHALDDERFHAHSMPIPFHPIAINQSKTNIVNSNMAALPRTMNELETL